MFKLPLLMVQDVQLIPFLLCKFLTFLYLSIQTIDRFAKIADT